jgi:hypothetical protein
MSAKLRGVVLTKDILFGMNLLSLAGFPRHGAQPYLTPHGKRGYPLEHWADVRWNSSGILRAVFCGLVKLAQKPAPFFGNHNAQTRQ